MSVHFPPGFLWGVSTAGHQVDGNDAHSDTTFLENVVPSVFQEPAGMACNSWELWEQDLDLVVAMGLNTYRFSIEWARIEPAAGEIDENALSHYDHMIAGCEARGITPLITLSHFTSPHWFAARGAWLDAEAAELFARFARLVTERFGHRVSAIVTFNEPNLPEMLSWANLPAFVAQLERDTLEAAAAAAGVERYRAGNVMTAEDFAGMRQGMSLAHVAAKAAIKAVQPDLRVGLSLAMCDDIAAPGGEEMRDRKRSEVYDYWLKLASEDDFVGVQNYERLLYGPEGLLPVAEGTPINEMGSAVEPDSLRGAVEYAHAVSGVPILVSEHGLSTSDDTLRQRFIEPSLLGLHAAIEAGVPVLGYCHWTLLDNFEWIFGYSRQLGLHTVDRETFVRTPKPSAAVYADLVKRLSAP